MPKCNSVLQTENDLFQHEILPNLSENCHYLTSFRTPKSSKTFGHSPVKSVNMKSVDIIIDIKASLISEFQRFMCIKFSEIREAFMCKNFQRLEKLLCVKIFRD